MDFTLIPFVPGYCTYNGSFTTLQHTHQPWLNTSLP